MDEQPPAGESAAERLAEVMAWHGMARYADPDDLAAHVRPAAPPPPVRPREAHPAGSPGHEPA